MVLDLETAPQRSKALRGQIERVLAQERGLAAASGPREYGELAGPVTLQYLVEHLESLPLESGNNVWIRTNDAGLGLVDGSP